MRKCLYFINLEKRLQRAIGKLRKNHPEILNNIYPDELIKLIEMQIELFGHAYCMDVKKERRKMSKLVFNLLKDLTLNSANQ